jgi:hypothetical protein
VLPQTQGDILDDSKAVEALTASKALALDIEEKQVRRDLTLALHSLCALCR